MGGSGSGSPARLWSSCRLGPQSSDGWAGAEGPFPRASTCSDGPGSVLCLMFLSIEPFMTWLLASLSDQTDRETDRRTKMGGIVFS